MSYELSVLRTLVRLSRRQPNPSMESIVGRVGGNESTVSEALSALESLGLVTRTNGVARLTLEGLALGMAAGAAPASREVREVKATQPEAKVEAPAFVERRSPSRRMTGRVASRSGVAMRAPARRAA